MKAPADIASADYASAPILCAYDQFKNINEAPLFALQYNGTAKLDNGTQCDYSDEMNAAGSNAILSGENDWLVDHKWHYYTAVFNGETAQVFIDGTLKNEWNCGSAQQGLFENGENLKYVCLGGNQIDEMEDGYDSPFAFAHLLIKNSSMTPGEIKAQMLADFPDHEAYWESGDQPVPPAVKGDVNGDGSVDVADISAVISVMAGTSEYEAADVNEDGTVDVADISSIISIMAGGE